jgi:uncharacterized protein YcbK (DUF882 family)
MIISAGEAPDHHRRERTADMGYRLMTLMMGLLLLATASPAAGAGRARELSFHHLHTGERLTIVYREGDVYLPHALAALDRLLRDHRTGTVHPFDPALFDLLFRLREMTGGRGTYQVICGYRTPGSNSYLASRTEGIGGRSRHMEGKAIDVRLTGVPLVRLRDAALSLGGGGVGFYPRSDFIHLDTGPLRRW